MENVVLQLTHDEAFELLDWLEEEVIVFSPTNPDSEPPSPALNTLLANVYDKLDALVADMEIE